MIVLLHHPSAYGPPVGVWWWDAADGHARSSYLPSAPDGVETQAKARLGGARNLAEFEAAARRLDDRTPHTDLYQLGEVGDAWDPASFLAAAARSASTPDAGAAEAPLPFG